MTDTLFPIAKDLLRSLHTANSEATVQQLVIQQLDCEDIQLEVDVSMRSIQISSSNSNTMSICGKKKANAHKYSPKQSITAKNSTSTAGECRLTLR